MDKAVFSFESVVPHTGDMVLLDEIDCYEPNWLQASLTVRSNMPFTNKAGLPSWVGIELMAQSIGAYGGTRARLAGEPIKIGFLVGSRKYACSHSVFPTGMHLKVRVTEILRAENGLSVFECYLFGTDNYSDISASAKINVFQPEDPEQFLQNANYN